MHDAGRSAPRDDCRQAAPICGSSQASRPHAAPPPADKATTPVIYNAKSELDLLSYSFTSVPVVEALVRARHRVVQVTLVTDYKGNLAGNRCHMTSCGVTRMAVSDTLSDKSIKLALRATVDAGKDCKIAINFPAQYGKIIEQPGLDTANIRSVADSWIPFQHTPTGGLHRRHRGPASGFHVSQNPCAPLRTKKKRQVVDLLGALTAYNRMRMGKWWSRGELNPRPKAITGQFYMRSSLI